MRRLAALLVLAVVLTGCSGPEGAPETAPAPATSASPSQEPSPARAAPRPANKACYQLGYDEAVAPTSDRNASACTREHTSMTFLVGTLDTVVDGHLLAVDSDRVQEQVATTCPDRLGGFVGGTLEQRRLSMLRAVWFTPTVEQSDRGADWFRCDVIAVRSDGSLAPLTGRLAGVLGTGAGRDRYAMCGTAEPGTPDFRRVICPLSGVPAWRALSTVPFRPGPYPGEARVRTAGETPCQDAGRAVADDALNFRWGYEWPTADQWAAGQTYGICWAPA